MSKKRIIRTTDKIETHFSSIFNAAKKARSIFLAKGDPAHPQIEACEHFVNFKAGRGHPDVDLLTKQGYLRQPQGSGHVYINLDDLVVHSRHA